MASKILRWNTGRSYAAEGQIIEAIFVPDSTDTDGNQCGAIEFVDITRGIDGRFENVVFLDFEIYDGVVMDREFKSAVMNLYDGGNYTSTKILKLVANRAAGYKVGRHGG